MQFVQMIIHEIYRTRTFVVEFLHKSKSQHVRKQTRPGATLINPMFIEELDENEAMEQHFVEA